MDHVFWVQAGSAIPEAVRSHLFLQLDHELAYEALPGFGREAQGLQLTG